MEKQPEHPRPIRLLLNNKAEGLATMPAPDHYPHIYYWDILLASITEARYGYTREAIADIFSVFEGQRSNGLIPNMQFAKTGRRWDMERFSFNDWENSSEYTQPPLAALAVNETYQVLRAQKPEAAEIFLKQIYPPLRLNYEYFHQYRQNGPQDALIGVIHPHETGRDSDPTFDFAKPLRLSRKGEETNEWVDRYNIVADYTGAMAINLVNKAGDWDLEEARKHFWVNDVMFNCIYVDNLYEMTRLARDAGQYKDMDNFYKLAKKAEEQISVQMWQTEVENGKGAFYALGPKGLINEISISNLFPLILPNLQPGQLEAILNLMDRSFDTPFPLPSVATDSPNYDPRYQEKSRLWRGPTWINTNWYLVERGLRRQAARSSLSRRPDLVQRCLRWDERITEASRKLIEQGYFEFYDPTNGRGLRVKDFSWSTLADII